MSPLSFATAFIRDAVDRRILAEFTIDRDLEDFFAQQGYSCPRKIPDIYEQLQAPAIPVAGWQVRASQRYMLVLVERLATLVPQIKACERALSDLLDQQSDSLMSLVAPHHLPLRALR